MSGMPGSPAEQGPEVVSRGEGYDLVRTVGVWARVVVGLVLAPTGGVLFGRAWAQESAWFWALGTVALVGGLLLVLSAVYARRRPRLPKEKEATPPEEVGQQRDILVPLLGALLIYKYQLISHGQLNEALAEQRKSKPRRRLGQILLDRKLITRTQLDRALAHQREHFQLKQDHSSP